MKKRVLSALAAAGLAVTMLAGCGGNGGGGSAMDRCVDDAMNEGIDRDTARQICELFRDLDEAGFYDEFGN